MVRFLTERQCVTPLTLDDVDDVGDCYEGNHVRTMPYFKLPQTRIRLSVLKLDGSRFGIYFNTLFITFFFLIYAFISVSLSHCPLFLSRALWNSSLLLRAFLLKSQMGIIDAYFSYDQKWWKYMNGEDHFCLFGFLYGKLFGLRIMRIWFGRCLHWEECYGGRAQTSNRRSFFPVASGRSRQDFMVKYEMFNWLISVIYL